AELAGVKFPASLDGMSLVETLLGKAESKERTLYWEFHEGGFKQAVRMGDWKGIRLKSGPPLELYDIARDPSESTNIASEHPEIVRQIEEYLKIARTESAEFPVRRAN